MHGKRVVLDIDRRRYRCKVCGKTLFEPLPDMDAKRNMTQRLVKFIEARCLKETFVHLSREVGVDDKTIRHIFNDYTARLGESVTFRTPEVLGIDELKIIGEYRAIITNIGNNSVFDLLETRKKASLLPYFKSLPDNANVKVVTMDMWNVYRQVAAAQLPGRLVVADKFHVVRMANYGLECVRKKVRKQLDTKTRIKLKNERFVLLKRNHSLSDEEKEKLRTWSALFPTLGAAYDLKEAFYAIYDQPTRALAEKEARAWELRVTPEIAKEFRVLQVALRSWWDEIFAWYEYPITNAYTESINRFAKDINRMGRGYSFEVVRARLLYDQEARKPTTGVIRKRVRQPKQTWGFAGVGAKTEYETVEVEETVEYGPHIPTLCRLLEEGHFE